jgi:hypothetical protein
MVQFAGGISLLLFLPSNMNGNLLVLLYTSEFMFPELMFLFTCINIELKKKLKEEIISLVYVWCFLLTSVQISLVSIFSRIMTLIWARLMFTFWFAGYFNCQIKVGFGGLGN